MCAVAVPSRGFPYLLAFSPLLEIVMDRVGQWGLNMPNVDSGRDGATWETGLRLSPCGFKGRTEYLQNNLREEGF